MCDQIIRLALAALVIGVSFGSDSVFAASAEKGKAAFLKYGCWQCHGTQGQGSVATSNGKVLAPDPLPYEAFSAFVRSTDGAMPPYSVNVLPDAELADIHAYLASVPKAAEYKNIPLLSR